MASALLLPLSWLVRLAIARKQRRFRRHPECVTHSRHPLIVVGNLYVGGTGKTPVVIALVQGLRAHGWNPGVISRGYGARLGREARTGQGHLEPAEYGDEPALIARASGAPVAVHPDRALALRTLENAHPEVDLVIADDGLQHLALGRDLEIVVQDTRGIGNGRVLPAGPLREPASRLASVDIVITNLTAGRPPPPSLPGEALQLAMRLEPRRATQMATGQWMDWPRWLSRHGAAAADAVAGIGQPERFFSMLRACGITLGQTIALPDHAPFQPSVFEPLRAGIVLITAKDAVKCAGLTDERIWVVDVAPEFSDPQWLDRVHQILAAIAQKKSAGRFTLSA